MEPLKLFNDTYEVTKDKKGLYVYKANLPNIFKSLQIKRLSKHQHELPAFPVIIEMESHAKKEAEEYFNSITLDLVRTLKTL